MQGKQTTGKEGDSWLGAAFLGTAVLTLFLSRSIHSIGLGNNFDPGPKAFPIGISLLLLIGAFLEFYKSRKRTSVPGEKTNGAKTKTVLLLLCAFLIYVILLPWVGFALSTLVMATAMMILLGNSWKQSLAVSIILITLIYLLFVLLFKVPLPTGVFGLPF